MSISKVSFSHTHGQLRIEAGGIARCHLIIDQAIPRATYSNDILYEMPTITVDAVGGIQPRIYDLADRTNCFMSVHRSSLIWMGAAPRLASYPS